MNSQELEDIKVGDLVEITYEQGTSPDKTQTFQVTWVNTVESGESQGLGWGLDYDGKQKDGIFSASPRHDDRRRTYQPTMWQDARNVISVEKVGSMKEVA